MRLPSCCLWLACWVVIFNVPLAGAAAASPPTAAQLYDHTLTADQQFSYQGRETITYWNSGHTEAVVVSHLAPRLRRLDYTAPERREGFIFLSNGHEEWQYDPLTHEIDHYRLPPNAEAVADAASNFLLLQTNYQVVVAPKKQMLDGRKLFLLTISHRGNGILARRLWIDAATGLVIKEESYESAVVGGKERAKLAVTKTFTSIKFHPHLKRATFSLMHLMHQPGVHMVDHPAVAETPISLAALHQHWDHLWLTPGALAGFRLVSAALMRGPQPRLHLRYSDGLNLVSLFEQRRLHPRLPVRVPHSHLVRVGPLHVRVVFKSPYTVINWNTRTFILSLVGESPLRLWSLEHLALAMDDRKP